MWPEVRGDLTVVKWSHATNSIQKLEEALNGKVPVVSYESNPEVLPELTQAGKGSTTYT